MTDKTVDKRTDPKNPPADFKRLRTELTPEQFNIIDATLMARKGRGKVLDLVRRIQQDWKLITDIDEGSLMRQLIRYREKYIAPAVALGATGLSAEVVGLVRTMRQDAQQVSKDFDTLQLMRDLAMMQYNRALVGAAGDLQEGENTPEVTSDIMRGADLLRQILELEIRLGVVSAQPAANNVTINNLGAVTVSAMDTETQTHNAVSQATQILKNMGLLKSNETNDTGVTLDAIPEPLELEHGVDEESKPDD